MTPGVNFGQALGHVQSVSLFFDLHQPLVPFAAEILNSVTQVHAKSLGASNHLVPQVSPYQWTQWGETNFYYGYTWYVIDGSTLRRQNVYIDSPVDPNPSQGRPRGSCISSATSIPPASTSQSEKSFIECWWGH